VQRNESTDHPVTNTTQPTGISATTKSSVMQSVPVVSEKTEAEVTEG
jgi:hypothetical protein